MKVSIHYGREFFSKELPEGSTVGDLATRAVLGALGAPTEKTRFVVDGTEVDSSYVLEDGDEVFVETVAHSKA